MMDDEDVDDDEEEEEGEEEDAIPEEYDGVGFSHETTLSSITHQRTRHRQHQYRRSVSEDGMLPAHDVGVEGPSDIEEEVEPDEQGEVDEEDEEDVEIEPEAGSESEMLHERGIYLLLLPPHPIYTPASSKVLDKQANFSNCVYRKIPNSPPPQPPRNLLPS